jgi:putative resolvase
MNDDRKILTKILLDNSWNVLIVENKDRLTRFGFNYIETLLSLLGKKIDVVNLSTNDKEDLTNDLISIIYSFSARIYGKRKAKRKDQIKKFIEDNNEIG